MRCRSDEDGLIIIDWIAFLRRDEETRLKRWWRGCEGATYVTWMASPNLWSHMLPSRRETMHWDNEEQNRKMCQRMFHDVMAVLGMQGIGDWIDGDGVVGFGWEISWSVDFDGDWVMVMDKDLGFVDVLLGDHFWRESAGQFVSTWNWRWRQHSPWQSMRLCLCSTLHENINIQLSIYSSGTSFVTLIYSSLFCLEASKNKLKNIKFQKIIMYN